MRQLVLRHRPTLDGHREASDTLTRIEQTVARILARIDQIDNNDGEPHAPRR